MTYPFIWDPFFSYPNRGIVEKKHHRWSPPATATPVGGEDVSAGQIQATLRRAIQAVTDGTDVAP